MSKAKVKTKYAEAVVLLPGVERDLIKAAAAYTEAYAEAAAALKRISAVMNREGAAVARLRARRDGLRAVVDLGPEEISSRQFVENPDRADEHVAAQLEAEPQVDAAVFSTEAVEPSVPGLIEADVNLRTRIGGLWRVKQRTEAQTMAAAHFRTLWDMKQIGGARAIDYTALRVDTSGPASADAVLAGTEDARVEYDKAKRALETRFGPHAVALCECVICNDMSLGAMARSLKRPDEGKGLLPTIRELLQALDLLAGLWGMDAAQRRSRLRRAGDCLVWVDGKPQVHAAGGPVKEPA